MIIFESAKRGALLALLVASALGTVEVWATTEAEERLASATGRDRFDLLVDLATEYREEDPSRALELGSEALAMLEADRDRRREIEILNTLAHARVLLGDHETSLQLATKADELARQQGDKAEQVFALRVIGRAHRSSSAYPAALAAYRRAAALASEIDERPQLGDALNDMGVVYWYQGDYPEALDFFMQARQTYEELGDRQRLAAILNNIGMVHRRLEQPDRALALYREALEVRREVGPKGAVANVLNNIGNVYVDIDEPALALEHYLEALQVGPTDEYGRANTVTNIGSAYEGLGDLDRALEQYQAAIQIKEAIGDRMGVGLNLIKVGSVERQSGELQSSLATLKRSLTILEEVEARDEIKDVYEALAETYAAMGRYREALAAFKGYEQKKSEIFNEQNSKIIAEMEARFESDRKEKEIEILRQQKAIETLVDKRRETIQKAISTGLILLVLATFWFFHRRHRLRELQARQEERERYVAELETRKAEVEARNAEMERFTYTVSHDLKSPLVTIRGFLGLLERDAESGDTKRMKKDMRRISAAADRMAQLLEELLQLSRIGRVVNEPEDVSMKELASETREQLASQIEACEARVMIAEDLPPVVGDRARLAEVLQNLVENSLKFMGDQASPQVDIGWRRDSEHIVFFVRDNGVGIDPAYQETIFGLFERLDPSVEGTGIGLALAKRIVEVHGGRLWVESDGEGHGAAFCFTLSAAQDVAGSGGAEKDLEPAYEVAI